MNELQELVAEMKALLQAGDHAACTVNRIALCQAEQLSRIADALEELLVLAKERK